MGKRLAIDVYCAVRTNWQGCPAEDDSVPMVLLSDHERVVKALQEEIENLKAELKEE